MTRIRPNRIEQEEWFLMNLARESLLGKIGASVVVLSLSLGMLTAVSEQSPRALPPSKKTSHWRFTKFEECMMRKINRARRRHGRALLQRDKQLGYVGRRHTDRMARYSSLWHDDVAGKVTRWRSVGQNVGTGYRCRRLFRSFMRSYTHRKNILGRWRFMAVANEWRNGRVYVHMIFESRRDPGNIWHYP